MRIVALLENSSQQDGLSAEHGLSFLIEADDKKILFDTGATRFFLDNAKKLAIDIDDIDYVVLSHGHYDHVGGLEHLRNKKVYIHPDIFIPKYDCEVKNYEYAGFPLEREDYEQDSKLDFIEIQETTSLTSNIKIHANFKKPDPSSFCIKVGDDYIPDLFTDELVLSVNTPQGLVVVTGCSHTGVLNILDKAISDQNNKNIFALLGGLHLRSLSRETNQRVAKELKKYEIKKIGVSHCIGNKFADYVDYAEVFNFNTGDVFNF